ncbi:MAG TPA: M14 family zinc carboxypeptidase [Mycobacteriales bacterium]|nr:M14 family zinc carboxypeptidase [Mycobacteriales bacterium]
MGTRSRWAAVAASVTLATGLAVPLTTTPAAAAGCDPVSTVPQWRGDVPSPRSVLGFELGQREVTTAESDRYLSAVDAATPRVTTGVAARSVQGRELRYAIVGRAANVSEAGLARIRGNLERLQDPATSTADAAALAASTPAVLWIAANVHGNEESGTDASLRVLRELADRSDCAAQQILDNAIVVILPVQNPDGREMDTRRNAYGFDMNRDWFARTQTETDGKLELLRQYPPQMFIDAHEMGRAGFFFPPNADPVYHEISAQSVDWINNIYGRSLQQAFTRKGIPYFNYDVYDLFYMGYGDTVPSTGFNAAGMTYEKANGDPIAQRLNEQYLAQWVSLSQGALRKQEILRGWHTAFTRAATEGRRGLLEPNTIIAPGNEVENQVPDLSVRSYFLRDDDPAKRREVEMIVHRLQRMDVEVSRLTAPLTVPDFKEYGRSRTSTTLEAGTYWISMNQKQKHWVQAMLNEDTYVPFPYFYDVTAWSLPLLANVRGGYSGRVLSPKATPVPPLPAPSPHRLTLTGAPALPADLPRVAVLQLSADSTDSIESTGWLRWRLERDWKLPYSTVTPAGIAAGALDSVDVLLVPDGPAETAAAALGATGEMALRTWVNDGGRYIGWQGGTELAARVGVSTAQLSEPTSDVPGSLLQSRVDTRSPFAAGVGNRVWSFYAYDAIMRASQPSHVVVSYPFADDRDWQVSGFARGAEELGGTAAMIDEPVGRGDAVVFAAEPNFRGFTDGTAKLLYNSIVNAGSRAPVAAVSAGSAPRQAAEATARTGAGSLLQAGRPIRVSVRPADAAAAGTVLRELGARWTSTTTDQRVSFVVANPGLLATDEHPWASALPSRLTSAGIRPLAVVLP